MVPGVRFSCLSLSVNWTGGGFSSDFSVFSGSFDSESFGLASVPSGAARLARWWWKSVPSETAAAGRPRQTATKVATDIFMDRDSDPGPDGSVEQDNVDGEGQ